MSSMNAPLVLLVDDHADTREMYAVMLGLSGFAVLEAEDGASALAQITAQQPSVVVTDLRMPGAVPVLDVCRRLHETGVPVIVLTGLEPGPERDDVDAVGCAVVLLKPVAPDVLIAEIRRILSSSQDPAAV